MYRKYLNWARTHGSRFNLKKSELIYFTGRRRKAYKALITLKGKVIKPTRFIRFLEVYLDEGLLYKVYLITLNIKILILLNALKSITIST